MKSLMARLVIYLILYCTLTLHSICALATDTIRLADYFHQEVRFDPAIPTPKSVLGYQVGEWHVRHDQIVNYLRVLAEKSPRMALQVIGQSHQQRPLLLLTVANPQRLANIQQIRQQHLAALQGAERAKDAPAIVWMGYSVHGNEPSGANAALLLAYYLAAATGDQIDQLLDKLVILIDPSLNPDGLDRFSSWVNSHKGSVENLDTQDKEHHEQWPKSRTNHYWFDLNRDWLLLRHPESRARVEYFHRWKPNVLTDFHEMGSHASFFFQPGISSRKNPWTPVENVALTAAIAEHHVAKFDEQGVLYYSQEDFDDFYYGKGSTYPDINGGVGILFEQASSRGFAQDTINGPLRFPQTIKNQLTASLSTLSGAIENRSRLLAYQVKFYQGVAELADKDDVIGYLVQESHDKSRLIELLDLLSRHQIKAYPLLKSIKASNKSFNQRHTYFVPLNQAQYRLIKSIFSLRQSFDDNTFYDVSSWNLAHAFNIEFAAVRSDWGLKTATQAWQPENALPPQALQASYAYALEWNDQKAAKMLAYLLKNNIDIRAASKPFTAQVLTHHSENVGQNAPLSTATQFAAGTLIINSGLQTSGKFLSILNQAQTHIGIQLKTITSGWTPVGIDLGSRLMKPINLPKVMIVTGAGVNPYEAGEVWHFMNKHMDLAPSMIDQGDLDQVDLSRYTHIYMVSGKYAAINSEAIQSLTQWIKQGGVLWGQKTAAQWLIDNQFLDAEYLSRKAMNQRFKSAELVYGDKEAFAAQQRIAGAIFSVDLDLSHPLTMGYHHQQLPVFKNSTLLLQPLDRPFVTVARYGQFPHLAGYADKLNVEKIALSSFMLADNKGKGVVIGIADNVNFRGFWYGTSRLMANSLYFSNMIDIE